MTYFAKLVDRREDERLRRLVIHRVVDCSSMSIASGERAIMHVPPHPNSDLRISARFLVKAERGST